ncbi:MAG: TetR/AcrR family transcriptional regulator [Aquamicrobium sp.]|jgi:TetR/AcrR family transcriptional regulator of autoinduction and epiphytic fitness|uniref:TetR/AcrR family transcriptional regulator n=1 Tax=Mesorhizobium sp. Pch-S TaxID=2082387 RepID=UPI001012DF5B|nr:TetR/AcrR family transcriptional regulator [Mesorhizobium sp. Pch-S]MBR2686991.1 TetR/AcrR family transcriptional regulator [Aquamicrobium sp.]QAZ41598.1 TetR family transcriptional regulator [Mesorhizobium sp. Pch-S]
MPSLKRTERSRNLILDAADGAFREFGFENTSVEEIAGRAGLTRKTVYNLFASKEDIALSLIARVEANDASYRELMTRNTNVTELLELVLTDSAGWCMANPSLARLALAPSTRPSLEPPSGRPSFQGLVRDILALGQQQGLVRRDEEASYMALVLLGIYGQAMLNSLAGEAFDHSQVRRLVRIVVEGIGPQA